MPNKSVIYTDEVSAGGQDIQEFPIIPLGEKWIITKFGGADIQFSGDGASSVYVLQWGSAGNWETLRILSISGDTKDLEMGKEVTGDGVNRIRLIRQNKSSTNARELPVWIDAYSRS